MKPRAKKMILIAPLAIVGMAAFLAVGGEIVRLLWNWLSPAVFGGPRITFWQALGLLALCRILFAGFGWRGSGRSAMRRRMAERFESMTPEEREHFREKIRERWCFGSSSGESKEP
jgi:hypothetical protein